MPRALDVTQSIEELLVAGSDRRISLDPATGLNKYGCLPRPDPALLAFGSSTASVISTSSFDEVTQQYERLFKGAETMEEAWQRISEALLSDVSDMGASLAFASSGTDAHALAVRSLLGFSKLFVLMVEESETGSGVRAAMSVHHAEIKTVSIRKQDGMPRAVEDIDSEVVASAESALARGYHVLLVMVDQSKTGMISPSVSCAMALRKRYPEKISVLVDACQFRIAPHTLRAYLGQGFMVAITGSKFLTGPAFSAALMLPQGFDLEIPERKDLGLLLRWEAALVEYRRFRALSQIQIMNIMESFGETVRNRLAEDPRFESLTVPPLDRRPLLTGASWDQLQSIFPFLLYRRGQPLNHEETQRIYRLLQESDGNVIEGQRCQLGQPVFCGKGRSALRIALSARLISDAADQGMDGLLNDVLAVLGKTVYLVDKIRD